MSLTKLDNLLKCSACGHDNNATLKFCAGCGHSLYEPCNACGEDVLLNQKFCGACGCDLESVLNEKRKQFTSWLSSAIQSGKEFRFDESLNLLQRVADQKDHRYRDLVSQAEKATEKIIAFRNKTVASADKTIADAKAAAERDDKLEVVRLLSNVPEHLLDEESKSLLAKFRWHQEQTVSLVADLQAAMKDSNFSLAGNLLDQLLQLNPNEPKLLKLTEQVSSQLIKSAERRFAKKDYGGAIEKLNSVCARCRDDKFNKMYEDIQDAAWLSTQCEIEPLITPALVKLAIRIAKQFPDDQQAHQQAKDLVAAIKKRPSNPRTVFVPRQSSMDGVLGGEVSGHLAIPRCIEIADELPLRSGIGRYNVAIGLALTGLGLGRYQSGYTPKKRLLGGLTTKKKDTCWGIDLGASGIRAVKLRRGPAAKNEPPKVELVDTFVHEFELPLSHVSMLDQADELTKQGLQSLKETKELGDDPVWVNLCGSQLISRFLRLPPVKDKQAEVLLDKEIEGRIPFPLDELEMVRWMDPLNDQVSSLGRPAMVVAARKFVVKTRFELFESAEIKVTGVQPTPLALGNLASIEFGEMWHVESEPKDKKGGKESIAVPPEIDSATVVLVDAGATTTTIVLISRRAIWFWTTEFGGDEITTITAKTTGKTQVEAEKLKREPAMILHPADAFSQIDDKMMQCRMRLQKMIDEAEKQVGGYSITQSWCMGGASLAHGWVRNVMLK